MAEQTESVWGEQDDQGVDLVKLRYSLTLTPDERVERHQRAAKFALELMIAAERSGLRRTTESS